MERIYDDQKIYNLSIENFERTGTICVTCQTDPNDPKRYIIQEVPEANSYVKAIRHTVDYINHYKGARLFTVTEFRTITAAYMYLLDALSDQIQLFGKTINSPMYKLP